MDGWNINMFNQKYIFKVSIFQPAIRHISILVGFLARVDTNQKIKNHWISNDLLFWFEFLKLPVYVSEWSALWYHTPVVEGIRSVILAYFFQHAKQVGKKGSLGASWIHPGIIVVVFSCCQPGVPRTHRGTPPPTQMSHVLKHDSGRKGIHGWNWLDESWQSAERCLKIANKHEEAAMKSYLYPILLLDYRFTRTPAIAI